MSDTKQAPEAEKSADVMRAEEEARWAEERRINSLPFAELTIDQKFARMTQYVRGFEYWINRVSSLENEIHRLKTHTHDAQGKVVVPIEHLGGSLGSVSGAKLAGKHPLD